MAVAAAAVAEGAQDVGVDRAVDVAADRTSEGEVDLVEGFDGGGDGSLGGFLGRDDGGRPLGVLRLVRLGDGSGGREEVVGDESSVGEEEEGGDGEEDDGDLGRRHGFGRRG